MTSNDDRSGPTFAPTAQDYRETLERIGRRRKGKAKTVGMAAGGVTFAGLIVAVLTMGGGTADLLQQEQPAGGGIVQLSASPRATASPGASTSSSGAGNGGAATQTSPTPGLTARPNLPPPVGSATSRPTPQPAEAGITRTYSRDDQGAGITFCNGQVGGSQTHTQDTFCGDGTVSEKAIDAQRRVPIQSNVCENGAELGSKNLSFDTDREVDYAIYQGSTLIWRWSAGRPPGTTPGHSLATDPGECWYWSTSWRAVDRQGKALHGNFVLKTTSYAKELKSFYNPSSDSFTL